MSGRPMDLRRDKMLFLVSSAFELGPMVIFFIGIFFVSSE